MLAAFADAPAPLAAWRRRAIVIALTAMLAVGALLVARRLAGAFNAPLPAPQLVALAAVAGMISMGGRAAWRSSEESADSVEARPLELFVGLAGPIAMALLAVGSSYPSNRAAPWLLWLSLLVADQISARAYFRRTRRAPLAAPPIVAQSPDEDHCVLQQLVRTRNSHGVEAIHGTLRADFVAGQRHATLHVGFCPPLASLPEVAAEPAAGPDATVKIIQAFAHGARIEVRLAKAAPAPCHVLLDLAATPAAPTV